MDQLLMRGNEAIGESAIRAGCMAFYGYPITPQSELLAYMSSNMLKHGRVFVQTESEICAINAVFGSAAAGKRAMTSSASTAMSLKQECISHMVNLELPAVIVDVMRSGPGIGNILASQGDYNQATKGGGTGDYNIIVLAPNSVQEAADFTVLGFELADKYRNPLLLLADGIIGQMMEPVKLPPLIDPGLLPVKTWALDGCEGRGYRRIETMNSADDLEKHNIKLQQKFADMTAVEQRWEEVNTDDAEILIVAFGSVSRIMLEIVENARAKGQKLGLFRPQTLWPYPEKALNDCAKRVKALVVVEANGGMMLNDVLMATGRRKLVYFHGRMGGSIVNADDVTTNLERLFTGEISKWGKQNEPGVWKIIQPYK